MLTDLLFGAAIAAAITSVAASMVAHYRRRATHVGRPATEVERPAAFGELFGVREFRPLFGTYLLSTIGDELARIVLTVLVYQRTDSPLLSAITFAISYQIGRASCRERV